MKEQAPGSEELSPRHRGAKWLAWCSLILPLSGIVIYAFAALLMVPKAGIESPGVMIGLGIGAIPLMLSGVMLGIFALVFARHIQGKGIFAKVILGFCLNGLLLVLVVLLPLLLVNAVGHRFPVTPQARLDAATNKLAGAPNEEDKFYALDDAAKESFNLGKIDDANNYARELLRLAPKYQGDWNYGNAIQDGNLVLGRIAARDGRIEEAKNCLLEAGKSPGSPQMNSFGPNMSLAKDLIEKGETNAVLQYFELCRKFWSMDRGKLDQWSDEVKAGKVPDFGANLVY